MTRNCWLVSFSATCISENCSASPWDAELCVMKSVCKFLHDFPWFFVVDLLMFWRCSRIFYFPAVRHSVWSYPLNIQPRMYLSCAHVPYHLFRLFPDNESPPPCWVTSKRGGMAWMPCNIQRERWRRCVRSALFVAPMKSSTNTSMISTGFSGMVECREFGIITFSNFFQGSVVFPFTKS